MKFYTLLFVFCCLTMTKLSAQTLRGNITDSNGLPIAYATVYIRENTWGIVADEDGAFLTKLAPGTYTCEFSALGYEKKIVPVTLKDEGATLHIELLEQAYVLREITINGRGEDPAYAIMRKAIAHAPFHRHQVKSYLADIYIKGTLKTGKLPSFGSIAINDEEIKIKELSNKLFLMESQNEVTFTEPNHYEQKVLALSTTIPIELNDNIAMNVVTNNIYNPELFGSVSPLAPGAFSYYKFALDGVTTDDSHVINKIRVIPKKNNAQLVRGWLYIVDNTWNVQHADLTLQQTGMTYHNNVSFNEVKPNVLLPTAYDMRMNINMLGIKIEGRYYSSIQYKTVEANEAQTFADIKEPVVNTLPKTRSSKQQKAAKELEKLAAKEELTTRDAYKMARLMQAATESDRAKQEKQSLELKSLDSTIHVTRDTLALLRDSNYWREVRTQPLQAEEVLSYLQKDSLTAISHHGAHSDSIRDQKSGIPLLSLLTGGNVKLSKTSSFRYGGLLRAFPEYNFADGFWLGQQFSFDINLPKKRSLSFSPAIFYTTARKEIIWHIDGVFRYDRFRHGELNLSVGNTTEDYAGKKGTNRLVNSLASLLFAENTAKFYQKQYLDINHQIDIANGLRLATAIQYEKRSVLQNETSYSLFGKEPHSNLPHGYFYAPMPNHEAWIADFQVSYTPHYYYHIWRGEKFYSHSDYPTLTLHYRRGIPFGNNQNASFDMLEGSLQQTIRLNLFNHLFYGVNAGFFPSKEHSFLPDYKHFSTSESYVTNQSMLNSFSLTDNYRYATNDKWLQAHITLTSDYLLLKHLPFLQNYIFDEALHIRSLWIPGQNYSEAGYSIGNSNIGRIGVFVGFDQGNYDAVGFTISLPIINLF